MPRLDIPSVVDDVGDNGGVKSGDDEEEDDGDESSNSNSPSSSLDCAEVYHAIRAR